MSAHPGPRASGDWAEFLASLQQRVPVLEEERGTAEETIDQKALILAEESFEILKALRYRAGIATEARWAETDLGSELVDVLVVSAAIANRIPVNLSVMLGEYRAEICDNDSVVDDVAMGQESDLASASAFALAEGVLSVVISAREAVSLHPGHDVGTRSLSQELIRLVSQTLVVAERMEIALSEVAERKLRRDQLRLWSRI